MRKNISTARAELVLLRFSSIIHQKRNSVRAISLALKLDGFVLPMYKIQKFRFDSTDYIDCIRCQLMEIANNIHILNVHFGSKAVIQSLELLIIGYSL